MSGYGSEESSTSPAKSTSERSLHSNSDHSNDKGEYAETSRLSFQDLLKFHNKKTVWGLQFGKEVRENTLKNMQEKQCSENISSEVPQTVTDTDKAGGSKSMTEKDHQTPHSRKRIEARTSKRKNSTKHSDFMSPQKTRKAPLPLMDWADSKEVWLYMVYKEEASLNVRNPRLFEDFSSFIPRMRAILLDWVMEVCEVYHLTRVTYYLSVDYFDRFLSIRPDVPKNQLQLVGVTCLFLASKLEEVYPPKLTEFSYVCDGACSPEEILACELFGP